MDNSFLRLTTDFNEALLNENFLTSKIIENRYVQMLPGETFLQITNSQTDIAFGGNLKVELITSWQEVLQDITNLFFVDQFTDIHGIKQIAFEFGNINIDYGTQDLYLKLIHTVSNKAWFSSPFVITNDCAEETTRFDYKHKGFFKGISYDCADYFQSIRLTSFENDIDVQEETSEYTQTSGNIVSMRKISTSISRGIFRNCNNYTFKRLISLFSHDVIYINGYRSSNKPALSKSERLGATNFFPLSYEWNPTEEFRKPEPQINVIACLLTVSGISPSVADGFVTINWVNSAPPFDVLVEISLNNQLSWLKPDNLVLNETKDSAIYFSPDATHFIKITPMCSADNFGIPEIFEYRKKGDYNPRDYNPKDYNIRKL